MFAAAQKKTVNIYDSNGIELHCLKDHPEPMFMEYLPYHFLLSTFTRFGSLKYLDVSTGAMVTEIKSKKGEPTAMALSSWNAVVLGGHSSGEVSMWIPNMGKPVVTLLAHPSQKVTSIAVHPNGKYMATTGLDSRLKIWDMRNYKMVYDYFTPTAA